MTPGERAAAIAMAASAIGLALIALWESLDGNFASAAAALVWAALVCVILAAFVVADWGTERRAKMRLPRDNGQDGGVVHVARPALPWRQALRTECGLPLKSHPVISRDEFVAKVKAEGQRRAAMSTCMTCFDTAQRWPSWDEDPVGCFNREVESTWRGRASRAGERNDFRQELVAVAILIQRHRPEFDELLEDQAAIVPLAAGERQQ